MGDALTPGGARDGASTSSASDALRAAYERWKPRGPQRHLVLNTLVTEWSDDEARAISDLVFLLQRDEGWSVQLVGRYEDTLHRDGETWRFHHRVGTFLT